MYSTTVSITEPDVQGSFFDCPSTPHIYKKNSETLEDARNNIEELVWEAIEIEGLDSLKCHIDVTIEQNVEGVFTADVTRTKIPSSYVIWNSNIKPHIFQIDRGKSHLSMSIPAHGEVAESGLLLQS